MNDYDTRAMTGATERLPYHDPPTLLTSSQKPPQQLTNAILAVVVAVLVLALVVRLGNMEAAAPAPRAVPEWAQQGYYQDSFNHSFNDNSWHWDFCAGYCPR
jgi:hypothetical protein